MQKVKVTKHYDDYVPGVKMTSYDPKGGDKGDGVFEVSDDVAAKMREAGVVEGSGPAPKGDVDEPGKPGK